jgi:chitin disaccharide deacetylase
MAGVTAEVAWQLAMFRRLVGKAPTHIDSHQYVHRREPVRAVLIALARKLTVPLRHFSAAVRYCGDF